MDANARAFGMGGAFTALSDDASAIYWNPAGLTDIKHISFTSSLGIQSPTRTSWEKFEELMDRSILDSPYGAEAEYLGVIGLTTGNYGAGIIASGALSTTADGEAKADGTGSYLLAYTVSTARDLNDPRWDLGAMSLGINLKVLDGQRYDYSMAPQAEDPTKSHVSWVEAKGTGYSADIGVRLKVTEVVTLGLMARDVIGKITWNQVTTHSTRDHQTGEENIDTSSKLFIEENLKSNMRGGIAIKIPYLRTVIAADFQDNGSMCVGFEKRFLFNGLAFRMGKEFGKNANDYLTAGAGINLGPLAVDAALGSSDFFKENVAAMVSGKLSF